MYLVLLVRYVRIWLKLINMNMGMGGGGLESRCIIMINGLLLHKTITYDCHFHMLVMQEYKNIQHVLYAEVLDG